MKHICLKSLMFLTLLIYVLVSQAQTIPHNCYTEIGPSTEGRHFADAIDLGELSSTFHYVDARDSRQFVNDNNFPANDIYYTFVLKQPMDVIIHHFCSQLSATQLTVYRRKTPEPYEEVQGGMLEQIGYSHFNYIMNSTLMIWEPYLPTMPELFVPHFDRGFLCFKKLEVGIYYILSEGYRNANGIIATTIHGYASDGDMEEYPIVVGSYSSAFSFTDTKMMQAYSSSINNPEWEKDIFYQFTLNRPMDIVIRSTDSPQFNYQLYDNKKSQIAQNTGQELRVNKLLPGTYLVAGCTNSPNAFTTQIKGDLITLPGENMQLPINVGKYDKSFITSEISELSCFTDIYGENLWRDIYFRFELQQTMDIEITTCGSSINKTYITLLNAAGSKLTDAIQSRGTTCFLPTQAALSMKSLPSGTYYAVVEGDAEKGNIFVGIKGITRNQEYADPGTKLSSNKNYIRIIRPTIETSTAKNLPVSQSIQTIDYYDGLGRLEQKVAKGMSPQKFDQISLVEYDNFGRESQQWLPVVVNGQGGILEKSKIEELSINLYRGDLGAYSYPVYERGMLSRVVEQYGNGKEWHQNQKSTKNICITNQNNSEQLRCINYRVSIKSDTLLTVHHKGYYQDGTLFVTRTVDEDGYVSLEFKDMLDQIVLSRQLLDNGMCDTYYLYNDFGQQQAVLPPLASDALKTGTSWSVESTQALNDYAYFYLYDQRKRCIRKKLPGIGWSFYVYDDVGCLILSRDANQRARKEWSFSIPDESGRMVLSGTCRNIIFSPESYLKGKSVVARCTNSNNVYKGYDIQNITLDSPVIYIVNYYDDYRFLGTNNFPNYTYDLGKEKAGYGVWHIDPTANYVHKGLLTGNITMMLDGTASPSSLYSVVYYDIRKRPIQIHQSNHLNGKETESYAYDFTGKILRKLHTHTAVGKPSQTELYTYTYDHAGRLMTSTHQLNNASAVILVSNQYDELGRLQANKRNGNTKLRTDYVYNIRSWTKKILGTLFNQTLYYNDIRKDGTNIPSYSGNISAMDWNAYGDKVCGYDFMYDELSQLKATHYLENGIRNSNYNTVYTYDKHGNIIDLSRYGNTGTSTYGLIDNLTMTYNGNQLIRVVDTGTTPSISTSADFRSGSSASVQYLYDANGNLKQDLNKGIGNIAYNSLNLPGSFTISNSLGSATNTYVYSADGRKLKVTKGTFTTDYCGNVIYENGSLKRILVDGGYYENGTYYFYLTDHLGNNRVVANQNGAVIQSTQYYPFGMAFADGTNPSAQPYKFGSKELDSDRGLNWYDSHARWQDAALGGRFLSVDPLAEKYYSVSPYVYCMNNPMRFVDPDGRDVWEFDENGQLVQRIKDKTQDAFYRVGSDGNRLVGEGTSVIFKYGTVTERNQTVSTDKGEETLKIFEIKGDKNATDAFNMLIGGDGKNQVEWGHVKIGTEDSGRNLVGTSNNEAESLLGSYALGYGYTIRESNHNHPSGDTRPSESDVDNAKSITDKFPNATFNIFGKPGVPIPFNKSSDYIKPNYPGAKMGKLVPGKKH